MSYKTTFSPNLHLVEHETLEFVPILQHLYHDFSTSNLKQGAF